MAEYPKKIALALHQVMQACGYVQKKQVNSFHRYKYAGEADLLEVLRPAMIDAGLILIPSGCERSEVDPHGNTHVTMEYTLVHKDGDVWPDKIRAFGTGNDKSNKGGVGDKGTYKAVTGANKYLLFKLFQIETGDDPEISRGDDEETPAPDNGKQLEQKRVEQQKGEPEDWRDYAGGLRLAINTAKTAQELDELLDVNRDNMTKLRSKSKPAADAIDAAIAVKRQQFKEAE